MRRSPNVGDWIAIKAPDGFELELDVSHPHGKLRHRPLPNGEWREGNVPVEPSLEEIIDPSIAVGSENCTGGGPEFLEDLDGKTK